MRPFTLNAVLILALLEASNAFSVSSRTSNRQIIGNLPQAAPFISDCDAVPRLSPLFSSQKGNHGRHNAFSSVKIRLSLIRRKLLAIFLALRRKTLTFAATIALCFVLLTPQSAQASSPTLTPEAPSNSVIERVLQHTSPTTDEIIDQYVKDHMFDEETYDPVSSIYREGYDDATVGKYPNALREATGVGKQNTNTDWGKILAAVVQTLERRLGLSRDFILILIATSSILGGCLAVLMVGVIAGDRSKRGATLIMRDRYGDMYSSITNPGTTVYVDVDEDDDEDGDGEGDGEGDDDESEDDDDDGDNEDN